MFVFIFCIFTCFREARLCFLPLLEHSAGLQDGDLRFGIADLAAHDHFVERIEGDALDLQKLVLIEGALTEGDVLGKVHGDLFADEGGRGIESAEEGIRPRDGARLFVQLPLRRLEGIFLGEIQLPCRNLEEHASVRVAELPLHQHTAVGEEGQNAHRADMEADLPCRLLPVREFYGILHDVKHLSVIDLFA